MVVVSDETKEGEGGGEEEEGEREGDPTSFCPVLQRQNSSMRRNRACDS